MLLAETASPFVTILIVLVGSGGLLGSVIAVLKIRPEANTAAVTQAQGAMETAVELNELLKATLERETARCERLEAEAVTLRKTVRTLQDVITGFRIMEDDDHFPPTGSAISP